VAVGEDAQGGDGVFDELLDLVVGHHFAFGELGVGDDAGGWFGAGLLVIGEFPGEFG
jgi:hypothetical protein